MTKKKIHLLFINLPLSHTVYGNKTVYAARPNYPNLTLATLAGNIKQSAHCMLLDLEFAKNSKEEIKIILNNFQPDFVAITLQTVGVPIGIQVATLIKKMSPYTKIVVGGVHVTTFPLEFNIPGLFDYVVIGEGDFVLNEIISGTIPPTVFCTSEESNNAEHALACYTNKQIHDVIDMDSLAFPYWEMFDISQYKHSHLTSRKNPVGLIETSRGCAYTCNFCNKNTFGHFYRYKSAERVVAEFFHLKKVGFQEVHVADDSFTQNLDRAKLMCELLIKKKFDMPWSLFSGVRVDCVDKEFFQLAQRSGLWSVSFGIESGDQSILDTIKKGSTISQIEYAVNSAHEIGLDTLGFFMLGLSGETEQSMQQTIHLSTRLPLTVAKFGICIPYPGSDYYAELKKDNRIRINKWSDYVVHQPALPLFEHPHISWETLRAYYYKAYRAFYVRPLYWKRRLVRAISKGDLWKDVAFFIKNVLSLVKHS